ncbi:VOC family protein [Luteipulveratus halotolerans]|uniref:Glyoxalase-like domain-containing protein n=1 Tax=Luteipulveratus halotolerans TaxID=1631356 RepID=A0A0L6CLN4_9MICO|nr:VOC family protein [Luteipulveratus halotolerans]KNX38644.1 hypothetical protein VV01_18255 [Luteipulveratus halotolerans]
MSDHPFVRQVVLDCPDPRVLGDFYCALLGYTYRAGDVEPTPDEDWLVIRPAGDEDGSSGRGMALQKVDDYDPPVWSPEPGFDGGTRQRQMLHLDMTAPDLPSLTRQRDRALELGARLLYDRSDDEDEPLYVFADPADHPFCIFIG